MRNEIRNRIGEIKYEAAHALICDPVTLKTAIWALIFTISRKILSLRTLCCVLPFEYHPHMTARLAEALEAIFEEFRLRLFQANIDILMRCRLQQQ